jgi:hypothetical protein
VVRNGGGSLMLTAAHVVGSLSAAHSLEQYEVLHGTNPDCPQAGDPRIGEVIESHPPQPCEEITLDACLVQIDDHVTLGRKVRGRVVSGRARDLTGVDDYVTVFKRGINAPKLTKGLLDPTFESLKVEMPQGKGKTLVRHYLRGWFVHGDGRPFARPGDSGSIVVDEDDCVVAMVVALLAKDPQAPEAQDLAFVIPICDVLTELKVRLTGPDRPCTLA